jgi:hypothetical protein
MLESPIAASMLMNAPIDANKKQYENFDCYENERDDYGVQRVNLTHNMQE